MDTSTVVKSFSNFVVYDGGRERGRDSWHLIDKATCRDSRRRHVPSVDATPPRRRIAAGDDDRRTTPHRPLYATPAIQQVTMATEHAHHQQLATGHISLGFSGEKSFGRWRHLVGGRARGVH